MLQTLRILCVSIWNTVTCYIWDKDFLDFFAHACESCAKSLVLKMLRLKISHFRYYLKARGVFKIHLTLISGVPALLVNADCRGVKRTSHKKSDAQEFLRRSMQRMQNAFSDIESIPEMLQSLQV